MATIIINGQEFKVGPELKAARVLAAACLKFAPGDVHRFKLFDEDGNEVALTEAVGMRRLKLWDSQTSAVPEAHRKNGVNK